MNTTPQSKRFKGFGAPTGNVPLDAEWRAGLKAPDLGAKFADAISMFEHLEHSMAKVLTVLLGTHDPFIAGYLTRTIINPKAKRDIFESLLHSAPINRTLPPSFDNILSEYKRISKQRNDWVHGRWFTMIEDAKPTRAFVASVNEHGFDFYDAVEVKDDEFDKLVADTVALSKKIETETESIIELRQELHEALLRRVFGTG